MKSIGCCCGPGGKKVNRCPPSRKNWTMLLGQPLFLIFAAIHTKLMEDVQSSWSFRQPLIYFHVNTLRKQSLELDGNCLCFVKVGKEAEREFTIRQPIAFLKKKENVKLGQGGFVIPTSPLPAGKTEMKRQRIGQSFFFFLWTPNSWSEIKLFPGW